MNYSYCRTVAILTAIVAFLTIPSCAPKPGKLRWKLEVGKTYVYRTEVTGSWKIEGWELGERSGNFGNLVEVRMKVASKDDEKFSISEEVELIREGQSYKPSVTSYVMTPAGRVSSLSELVASDAPRVLDDMKRREQYFEQTQPTFPNRDLAKGDNWIQETKVVLEDRTLTAQTNYSVKGWEKVGDYNCLRIDYYGEAYVPYRDENINSKLLDRREVIGTCWFAPKEGVLIQQRDSIRTTTFRVAKESKQQAPVTSYIVESVRLHKLIDIK